MWKKLCVWWKKTFKRAGKHCQNYAAERYFCLAEQTLKYKKRIKNRKEILQAKKEHDKPETQRRDKT